MGAITNLLIWMESKFRYVLEQFERIFGVAGRFEIGYGLEAPARIRITKGHTGFFDQRIRLDTARVVHRNWNGRRIPFLFDDDRTDEIIRWTENGAIINYDIVSSAFYFLSGWREYVSVERDQFGRFPYRASIQHELDIAGIPVVNYYFDILKTAVERVYQTRLQVALWDGAKFATFVSHDIDKVDSGWKEEGLSALKQGNPLAVARMAAKRLLATDVWFNFDEILGCESRLEACSTFFFLCRKGIHNGLPHADYDVGDRRFEVVMDRILERGGEIGLHGSWGSHMSRERFQEDLSRLPEPVSGNRFHYLSFDAAATPGVLAAGGIQYDCTLGFAEHSGFRNGSCFPFFLFDIERNEPTEVIEIPLVLMDTTLSHYLDVRLDAADDLFSDLVAEVKKFQGCFSVLWHNNYFSPYKYRGWRDLFVSILRHCRDEGGTFLTGAEIAKRFAGGDGMYQS